MMHLSAHLRDKVRTLVSKVLLDQVEARKYDKHDPFTDKVRSLVSSGRGGDGNSSFMHVWGQNFAGPGGGNGGRGGSIYVVGNHKREDLLHIERMGFHVNGETGRLGGTIKRHGKNGENLVLDVPIGTVLIDVDTNQVVHDVKYEKGFLLLEGGRGGRGNASFAHSTNQSPIEFTKGLPGTSMLVQFEIRSVVDVGLIGFPNSGKSSVLCGLTSAQPEVTDWGFATRRPNIGYIHNIYGEKISIVDIPSLVDGAFLDRGIGHQFLRHIERTVGLVYVLDMTCASTESMGCKKSPLQVLNTLQMELEYYAAETTKKGIMVLANKMDHETDVYGKSTLESLQELQQGTDLPVFPLSAEASRIDGFHEHGSGMREVAPFLFNTILQRKREILANEDEERAELVHRRDKVRAEKLKWLRAGDAALEERVEQNETVARDKRTFVVGASSPFGPCKGGLGAESFSLYSEETVNDDEGMGFSANGSEDHCSLVDQQLDPYFGFSGVSKLDVHAPHFARGSNPLMHRDDSLQGRSWKVTRESDEVLTDEMLRNPLPSKD